MKQIAAEMLGPGDEFYVVALAIPDAVKKETWKLGEVVDVAEVKVLRTHVVPATAQTPDIIALECRDSKNTKRMLFFSRQEQVTLVPKPGKWLKIWQLLKK